MKKTSTFLIPLMLLAGFLALIASDVANITSQAAYAQTDEAQPHPGFMAAKGRVTFNRYCASCHGMKADGTGSVAKFLKVQPADLRKITQRSGGQFPHEELVAVIDGRKEVRGHGSREMPIWGDVLQSPLSEAAPGAEEPGEARAARMINELVYYLKGLQEPYEAEVPTSDPK
ncbi:MAG: cytochrome c [Acidobacteriota bacterium]|nr:cytochrome c [Acidobacteriota bacterium]